VTDERWPRVKAIEQAIRLLGDVSPDGRFIVGWTSIGIPHTTQRNLYRIPLR
jgi:hypothetical protein